MVKRVYKMLGLRAWEIGEIASNDWVRCTQIGLKRPPPNRPKNLIPTGGGDEGFYSQKQQKNGVKKLPFLAHISGPKMAKIGIFSILSKIEKMKNSKNS